MVCWIVDGRRGLWRPISLRTVGGGRGVGGAFGPFFAAQFPVEIRPASMDEQRRGSIGCSWAEADGAIDTVEVQGGPAGGEDRECVRGDGECGRDGEAWLEAAASQARHLVYLVTKPETIHFIAMRCGLRCRVRLRCADVGE